MVCWITSTRGRSSRTWMESIRSTTGLRGLWVAAQASRLERSRDIHGNLPRGHPRVVYQTPCTQPFVDHLKSALPFLAITLFLLPASSWAEGIDPKIHKQCKDARDYTGCVKAFTPLPPTSDDELSALLAAMKQVAARITTGFALRDATLFFQPVTDQLALVRSSHPESSAV